MSFHIVAANRLCSGNSEVRRYRPVTQQILQQATELCARGLQCSYAKALEYLPDEKRLIVRAGVGWPVGTVDHVSLGANVESPAGFAFQTGQSVISNHLQKETRFRTPKLLVEHGIKRAINVLIRRGGEGDTPFGVLEADSPDPGQFDDADADFLAGLPACWVSRLSVSMQTPSFRKLSIMRICSRAR
jgi:GAF domain-containing protein